MLEAKKLYPIKAMRTLDPDSLQKLSASRLMFCKDLMAGFEYLHKRTGISLRRLRALQQEAGMVCGSK